MSADNGLLLWKRGGEYVLSEYSGSVEYASPEEMEELSTHTTVGEAAGAAMEYMNNNIVEYGLSMDISEEHS